MSVIEVEKRAADVLHSFGTFAQARAQTQDGVLGVEGYLVTYGGDPNGCGFVWAHGAAQQSIRDLAAAARPLSMGYQHYLGEPLQVIGRWSDVVDREQGVYGQGRVSDTTLGRDAATLVQDEAVTGISVGFRLLVYQVLEPGQTTEVDTPYGRRGYQADDWCILVIQAQLTEASLVHDPADVNARIEAFAQSIGNASRALPGLQSEAQWPEVAYSMALLMGGRGAGAFTDLPEPARLGLYQQLAGAYTRLSKTPPPYASEPNYRDVAFQHDERAIFHDRYLRKSLAAVTAGAAGLEGPLSPETRDEVEKAVQALEALTQRRSQEELLAQIHGDLAAAHEALRQTDTDT